MHHPILRAAAAAAVLAGLCGAAFAQAGEPPNMIKAGVIRYDTNSKTDGISGIGVPAGAGAETSDATTLLLAYERALTPNIGVELVLGIPPKTKARASGSVAFLGEVLMAKNVAPTLLVNWHFGRPGDTWRPYVGAGINHSKFTDIESSLADDVRMSDSTGLALQAGIDYLLPNGWGFYASVARVDVKSKVVASGTTVLKTDIDFRPVTYSIGVSYRF